MATKQAPYTTLTYETEDEWLALRQQGIGGSDASVACGMSPYKQAAILYLEKRGEREPDDLSDNERVYWGTVLEDVVANEYSRRTGRKVRRVNRILQSKAHPFMLASLDRDVVGEKRILECKTTDKHTQGWGDPGTDQVPSHYLMQTQHYLAVTGAEIADLAVLIGGNDFRIYTIQRDEDLIQAMIQLETEFWKNVVEGNPPAIDFDAKNALETVKLLYPGTDGSTVELAGLEHWAQVEREAAGKVSDYQAVRDGAMAHILDYMKEAAIGKLPDGSGYTRKLQKRKGYTVEASESMVTRFNKKVA
jgi:putative phage-type endonuclease